jgi:hypothetical protein
MLLAKKYMTVSFSHYFLRAIFLMPRQAPHQNKLARKHSISKLERKYDRVRIRNKSQWLELHHLLLDPFRFLQKPFTTAQKYCNYNKAVVQLDFECISLSASLPLSLKEKRSLLDPQTVRRLPLPPCHLPSSSCRIPRHWM